MINYHEQCDVIATFADELKLCAVSDVRLTVQFELVVANTSVLTLLQSYFASATVTKNFKTFATLSAIISTNLDLYSADGQH